MNYLYNGEDEDGENIDPSTPGSSEDSSNSSDRENIEPEEIAVPQAPVSDVPDAQPQQVVAASAPMDKESAIRDYLQKQYAAANDTSGIEKARQNAKKGELIANIGQALEGLARSTSMAYGGQGVNKGFYEGLKQQDQNQLAQAVNERNAKLNSFLQQNEINRQIAQDMRTQGSYEQQQRAAQYLNDRNDPNSDVSKRAVASAQQLFPGYKDAVKEGMSAIEVDNALKGIEKKSGLENSLAMKKLAIQQQQAMIQNRKDAATLADARRQYHEFAKEVDPQTLSPRSGLGQAVNKVNSATRLMTFADVNPDELEATIKDPKAKAEMVKRLNQLTPQQYSEVVSGLMSQLTNGGTGSLGQFEHLKANTAGQTRANLEQYFSNNPVPANAGELVYKNLLTLRNEQKTSQDIIDKHNKTLRSKYPLAFSHPETAAGAEDALASFQPVQKPDEAVVNTTAASVHPQANQALEWAKAHPDDPRSSLIMKRIGAMNAGL